MNELFLCCSCRGSQAWSTATDSRSVPAEVRGFKSLPLHFFLSLPQMWIHPNKCLNKQGHFIQNDVTVFIPLPFHSCSIFFYKVEWNGTLNGTSASLSHPHVKSINIGIAGMPLQNVIDTKRRYTCSRWSEKLAIPYYNKVPKKWK